MVAVSILFGWSKALATGVFNRQYISRGLYGGDDFHSATTLEHTRCCHRLRLRFVAAGAADATEALEQKALALEERSRSLASRNESLQVRLDDALSDFEVNRCWNMVLRVSERERKERDE